MFQKDTLVGDGRYEVIDRMKNGGGMSSGVYVAEDRHLGGKCVLKVVEITGGGQSGLSVQELTQSLQDEARLLAGLNHPGLVRVLDHFSWSAQDSSGQVPRVRQFVILAEEFVEGQDLAEFLQTPIITSSPMMPTYTIGKIATQILGVLDYLNDRNIVYRDLKPANVIWNPKKEKATMVDFGTARSMAVPPKGGRFTAIGTVGAMAPEQMSGQTLDGRVDIYALGALMWGLGVHKDPTKINQFPLNMEELREARPNDHEFCLIVEKALKLDPSERFRWALEMLDRVKRWLNLTVEAPDNLSLPFLLDEIIRNDCRTLPRTCFGDLRIDNPHFANLEWLVNLGLTDQIREELKGMARRLEIRLFLHFRLNPAKRAALHYGLGLIKEYFDEDMVAKQHYLRAVRYYPDKSVAAGLSRIEKRAKAKAQPQAQQGAPTAATSSTSTVPIAPASQPIWSTPVSTANAPASVSFWSLHPRHLMRFWTHFKDGVFLILAVLAGTALGYLNNIELMKSVRLNAVAPLIWGGYIFSIIALFTILCLLAEITHNICTGLKWLSKDINDALPWLLLFAVTSFIMLYRVTHFSYDAEWGLRALSIASQGDGISIGPLDLSRLNLSPAKLHEELVRRGATLPRHPHLNLSLNLPESVPQLTYSYYRTHPAWREDLRPVLPLEVLTEVTSPDKQEPDIAPASTH